jgi:pyruvate formate lyase activating enzyme
MYFGGLLKNSLIDYPGKMSCVLFVSGCNFTCPYCHNPDLAQGRVPPSARISLDTVLAFLESRRGLLEGVVISGGEPTLEAKLPAICEHIHALGYPVKLDTNGSRPHALARLLESGCVDYVAMDIKAPPAAYPKDITTEKITTRIEASIDLMMSSGRDYEFRTTFVRPFAGPENASEIARSVRGARRYVIQKFNPDIVLDAHFFQSYPQQPDHAQLEIIRKKINPFVGECLIR